MTRVATLTTVRRVRVVELVFCASCAALVDWETTEAVGDGWRCPACREAARAGGATRAA